MENKLKIHDGLACYNSALHIIRDSGYALEAHPPKKELDLCLFSAKREGIVLKFENPAMILGHVFLSEFEQKKQVQIEDLISPILFKASNKKAVDFYKNDFETYNFALCIITSLKYDIGLIPPIEHSNYDDWFAEKKDIYFVADNPISLLGLIKIWIVNGNDWNRDYPEDLWDILMDDD